MGFAWLCCVSHPRWDQGGSCPCGGTPVGLGEEGGDLFFWRGRGEGAGGVSFSLSQDNVDESADESQGERHPGQDVGEAEG